MTRRELMGLLCGAIIVCDSAGAFAGGLQLGRVSGEAGQPVTIPVVYRGGRRPASALMVDIKFHSGLTNPQCAAGAALSNGNADKSVSCAERSPGSFRLILFGMNQDPIPNGEVATITFDVAATARPGLYALKATPTAAEPNGHKMRLAKRSGAVKVHVP